MAQPRILVLDESPTVRETIAILMGGDYEVRTSGCEEYDTSGGTDGWNPSLVIAGESSEARQVVGKLATDVRVLWLTESPEESTRRDPSRLADAVARKFSPYELRRRVDELLAQNATRGLQSPGLGRFLQAPFVPENVQHVIQQATMNDLPLLLWGEPGVGKRAVARAVHAARGGATFVTTSGRQFANQRLGVPDSESATLYIDGIDQIGDEGQQRLLEGLEPGGMFRLPSGASVRLITSMRGDLAQVVERQDFSADLYYRISVLTVALPPLRERVGDLPKLVDRIVPDLRSRLGGPEVSFTAEAKARLGRYLWFGNLTELEAVLARTLSACRKKVVDANDLVFESPRLGATTASSKSAPETKFSPTKTVAPPLRQRDLDLIINELAHEFKNPLVTIKTFAQHLRQLLAEGGDDEQVAKLTGEAVDRIDHTLENLLQFTRLDLPLTETFPLRGLVDPIAEEITDTLATRGARCKYEPPKSVNVAVDHSQATYALVNLARALTRDLGKRQGDLVLRFEEPADLVFELPPGCDPLAGHLATLLDDSRDAEAQLPLGMAIAEAVLSRNGAQLLFTRDTTPNTVTVRFTVAQTKEKAVKGNGKATHTDR